MPTLGEMRRTQGPPKRTCVIMTPMKMGGGYDGETTDFLLELAMRGRMGAGRQVAFLGRDYGGSTELSRARLAAVFMQATKADHLVFLDSDNAMDLETWDALMAVDGDVVCVPYIRRMPPHVWTVRLSLEVLRAPRVRTCGTERLLSIPGAGTGVMRISRDCMRRVWDANPELRCSSDLGGWMGDVFRHLSLMDPRVEPDGTESVPEYPWVAQDDYAFCARATAAGCRVEVLVDRFARHAGLSPELTLAQALWGHEGKPPKRDASET